MRYYMSLLSAITLLGAFTTSESASEEPLVNMRQQPTPQDIYKTAAARYAGIDSYTARLVRRERTDGEGQEQILIFYARQHPWSVRFKWLAGAGTGREVSYVKDRFENKIHVVVAPEDPILLPGRKISLPVDSPLVKKASREPITEAGIGGMIDRFGKALQSEYPHDVTVLGIQKRADYDVDLLMIEQRVPTGADPDVPDGGRRLLGFHSELHLPVLSILMDHRDQQVSYFRFDRLQLDVKLDDADFDPARMAGR